MSEYLITLFSDHGVDALAWILSALAALGVKYAWGKIKNDWARGVLDRAYAEIKAAVLEVAQVYADEIKDARADGKLTADERDDAKLKALTIAKANIGTKGLARLARVLGITSLDHWLANKVEANVRALKPDPM